MLTLFPKFKKRLILFEVLYIALMVVLYILKPGANSIAMLLMLLVGALLIAAAQYINAVNAHNRQLNLLYNQLDVEGFLKEYEPHLKQNPSNPNLYTMIRMHISNAYAAQGRFEDAMKLPPFRSKRERSLSRLSSAATRLPAISAIARNRWAIFPRQKNTSTSFTGSRSSLRTFRKPSP